MMKFQDIDLSIVVRFVIIIRTTAKFLSPPEGVKGVYVRRFYY